MNPRFVVRDSDPLIVQHLTSHGYPAPLARALAARGVQGPDDVAPGFARLLAPDELWQIDKAAQVLLRAIDGQQRILVVADYDCDGATACAVAVRGLRLMGAHHVDYLVPNRFEYGYGLTPELVDLAARRQPDLIITVDNGIASIDGVARASELGIAVLITDHHLPGAQLPAAAAIVNPNQRSCSFGSKHLAGVGVMFYVLTRLRAVLRDAGRFTAQSQPRLDALLDLVALGTIADLVRLDRNNRILVQAGLERIRRGLACPGLKALFSLAGRPEPGARASDLGFAIGPRVNAAGRLTDMTIGIACLLTDSPQQAVHLASQLDELNRQRRQREASMQELAQQQLPPLPAADSDDPQAQRTVTVFREEFHPGIVGLVAARLKEAHHRPTIVFAIASDEELRGSGRSIDGVHLRDTLDLVTKTHPGLIRKFGGHAMAAGLTIARADLETFTSAFEAAARAMTDAAPYLRVVQVDGSLADDDIDQHLADSLAAIVWGQGFADPLFADVFDVLDQRLIKDAHLKLTLRLGSRILPAIWFRRTQALPPRARLAYRPVTEEYRGRRQVSLHIAHMANSGG